MPRPNTKCRFRVAAILLAAAVGASPVQAAPRGTMARVVAAADGAAVPGAVATSPPPVSMAGWAGTARQVDLPMLLALALERAPALARAKLDIAVAEATMAERQGVDDWRLQAALEVSSRSARIGGFDLGRQTDVTLSASLLRSLSTGGTFGIHASSGINDSTTSTHEWTDTVTASITQPLLRGYGRDVARVGQVRAVIDRDRAVLARRAAAISLVQGIVSAYWELVYAERDLAISTASLDLARERLRVTEAGIKGGKIAASEALAVEQIIATRQEGVLGSELSIVERSISLRRSVGMEIGPDQLVLTTGAVPIDVINTPTLQATLAQSLATSPELAELALAERDATIVVELSANGLLPQLDAALSFGPSGRGSFGGAARNMVTFDELAIAGSLTLDYDLGGRAPAAQSKSAQLAREQVRVTAADVEAQIAEASARALAQVELARQRLSLSRRAIDLALRNIAVEQARFDLGKSTSFDVLQRQDELRSAQLREVRAQIDAQQAALSIQALTGEVLPEFGITVE